MVHLWCTKIGNKILGVGFLSTPIISEKGRKMTQSNLDKVEKLVTPIVETLGLQFVDCDLKKERGNLTLTIYIDKPSGITLSDCEAVSKAIDEPLDELDVTHGESYNLNVSSPGLDRPLKKEIDFKRNLNKEVLVKFYKTNENGKKQMEGTLTAYTTDNFTILVQNEPIVIEKKLVAIITPVIKF